jgi:hypothetical protein
VLVPAMIIASGILLLLMKLQAQKLTNVLTKRPQEPTQELLLNVRLLHHKVIVLVTVNGTLMKLQAQKLTNVLTKRLQELTLVLLLDVSYMLHKMPVLEIVYGIKQLLLAV